MASLKRLKQNGGFDPEAIREYRRTRRESQYRFWSRFGVTQSRGSRFEMGTEIPTPVAILLKLYLDGVITDNDL
jgi:DNA-binding transcriptional regulator YiaG